MQSNSIFYGTILEGRRSHSYFWFSISSCRERTQTIYFTSPLLFLNWGSRKSKKKTNRVMMKCYHFWISRWRTWNQNKISNSGSKLPINIMKEHLSRLRTSLQKLHSTNKQVRNSYHLNLVLSIEDVKELINMKTSAYF